MSHESKYTSVHDEIRRWVTERGGQPATIADSGRKGEEVGVLRIDMPGGASNPPLQPISWDDFFQKFDESDLVFLYQDETAEGEQSHFCKFISRETALAPVEKKQLL
jgi:hypothetical protein